MMPIPSVRRSRLGESPSREMIDYWQDQYRNYRKDLDALWNRLRPGFAEVRRGFTTPAAPAPAPAPKPSTTVAQVDKELTKLYDAQNELHREYMVASRDLKKRKDQGWPGEAEWRKKQLDRDYAEAQATLYNRMIQANIALLAKVKAMLLDKEAVIRALVTKVRDGTLRGEDYRWISPEEKTWIATHWKPDQKKRLADELRAFASRTPWPDLNAWANRAAETLAPTPRRAPTPPASGAPFQPPAFWEDLCALVRNLEAAEQEKRARAARGAPAASQREAEQEFESARRDVEQALQGRFPSVDQFYAFWLWCRTARGVRLDWTRFIRTPFISPATISTPAPAPTDTSTSAAPAPAPGYYVPYGFVMTGRKL